MNPPLSKYFQWRLHDVSHVLTCIVIFQQCLTLKGLQGTAPVPTSCPCCFVLSCVYMWSRSLFFLSTLVCNVLPRRLFHGSPKAHCQNNISVTILTSTAWRTLGLFGAFPTRARGVEGALALSCRASQGNDPTPGEFLLFFPFFRLTAAASRTFCDLRRVTLCDGRVASRFVADLRRPQVEKNWSIATSVGTEVGHAGFYKKVNCPVCSNINGTCPGVRKIELPRLL